MILLKRSVCFFILAAYATLVVCTSSSVRAASCENLRAFYAQADTLRVADPEGYITFMQAHIADDAKIITEETVSTAGEEPQTFNWEKSKSKVIIELELNVRSPAQITQTQSQETQMLSCTSQSNGSLQAEITRRWTAVALLKAGPRSARREGEDKSTCTEVFRSDGGDQLELTHSQCRIETTLGPLNWEESTNP